MPAAPRDRSSASAPGRLDAATGTEPATEPAAGFATGYAAELAAELAAARPALSDAYAAALPGAASAVLGRLWRALLYEPLPGLTARGPGFVRLRDGRLLTGPGRLPHDLGPPAGTAGGPGAEPVLSLDGRAYTHPAALLAALDLPGGARLIRDLERCVACLALSRAGAACHRAGADTRDGHSHPGGPEAGLVRSEQDVVDGHPYHPCCRNRPGFSVEEQLAYAPEHRPVVGLDLVAVPAARCLLAGPWPEGLRDGDRVLLPVHPWQRRHRLPELGLRPYAIGAIPARPLICLRTLAPTAGGPHVKTAVSARMTSHVRDISPASVRDCVALSALLTRTAARLRGGPLRIARYLAGAAALVDGRPTSDVAVLLRESPSRFARAEGEWVTPFAALVAAPPHGGPPPVCHLAHGAGAGEAVAWVEDVGELVFGAALGMLALGVALEAHGQNLLLVLDAHGRPRRVVYRDLADIRVSPARLAGYGLQVPPIGPRLVSDDPEALRAKLFGSLVGTTFGGLIASLGEGDREAERPLWAALARAARRAFDALPPAPHVRADRAALFAPELPAKAHTLMQLQGGPPGDRWTRLPNPLA